MKGVTRVSPTYLYILFFVFSVLIVCLLFVVDLYANINEKNLSFFLIREINTEIGEKLNITFDISGMIASSKAIKRIMKKGEYGKLNNAGLFNAVKNYRTYKHLEIYIINRYGIYVHIPISQYGHVDRTQKGNPLVKRLIFSHQHRRISDFKKEQKSYKCICVGKNGIIFKGISPIYDNLGKLLGFVEVNTHFNSIVSELQKSGVDSAVVVSKRCTKYISHPLSNKVVDGYLISNLNLKPAIIKIMKKYGVDNLINTKGCRYVTPKSGVLSGYYMVSVPIKNNTGKVIGYYLGFFHDEYGALQKEVLMYIIVILIVFVFLLTSYVGYRYRQINKRLVGSLNKRVKRQTVKIVELMYLDNLTEVYNKIKFDEDIKGITQDAYIVMFDIRNFSKVNSIYGFETGDKVLKIVARRVKNIINSPLYRIHADEFVFISVDYHKDIARIKEKFIKEPIYIQETNLKLRLSFSFGVCKNDAEDILNRASIALKEAKKSPYTEFIIYKEQKINEDFMRFNTLLYDALFEAKDARIVPYFQGIRDNRKGEILKYEALARLITKDNVYPPFFFLDVAKSSGFVYEITKIIMENAMEYVISNNLNVDISINITEDDLNRGCLKEHIQQISKRYKIEPNRITLEILEGITSSGTKNNIAKLKELKELGVKLALDDFGVEYSNFERIAELDIDFIKIDGKYIKNVVSSAKSRKIVKAITDFAHSIDIEVVAEFVDDKDVQKIVESFGIEYSQGYLFSVPDRKIKRS